MRWTRRRRANRSSRQWMKCFQTRRRRNRSSGNGGGDTQRPRRPGKSKQRRSATAASRHPEAARDRNEADVLSPPAVEKKSGEVRLDEHMKDRSRGQIALAEPARKWSKGRVGPTAWPIHARSDIQKCRRAHRDRCDTARARRTGFVIA